jgi:hypothetical protein
MTETEKQELQALAASLQGVPESSRKLLAHIVELAYRGRNDVRQQDTAYLPELHESCGLDVEAMYETLQPLQDAGLIEVENQYPFEDVKLGSPGGIFRTLSRLCHEKKISLQEVMAQSRFDLLD